MFIWRSNLLGSSGKGHEYMLKHLLGTRHGLQGKISAQRGGGQAAGCQMARRAHRRQARSGGHAGFPHVHHRLYSDIVLPTATWYEKNDLNTSDMHPFIHPLSKAVDPAWEARSDWDIFKGIAAQFSAAGAGRARGRKRSGADAGAARHAG